MSRPVTRRSQSVVPFGVGSIVEFEDETLMPAGLEVWPQTAEIMMDDRLAGRLGVDHFKLPPPKPEKGVSGEDREPLPYVRFPRWHFCPRCRFLKKASLFSTSRPKCDNQETYKLFKQRTPCGQLAQKSRPKMIPLRFVAVCRLGHIEDFPWKAWAHTKTGQELNRNAGCDQANLYFVATGGGGLSGLKVNCGSCGSERRLMGATSKDGLSGMTCLGNRPWLGEDASEPCRATEGSTEGEKMVGLLRGASNVYFPAVSSSILIPPFSKKINQLLQRPNIWETITSSLEDGELSKSTIKTTASLLKVDRDQLEQAVLLKLAGRDSEGIAEVDETEYRFAEYKALHQEMREKEDALTCRVQDIGKYGELIQEYFKDITLVERLAETRVLTGFTRISPSETEASKLSRERMNWLPAFRVYGEGIFLGLNEEKLSGFEAVADDRIKRLIERIHTSGKFSLVISRELILLHTLAHILIKRLSYEAGYGSSSIRERIYSAPEGHQHRMCGILLYTAAGDADGTLGGLVGLGQPGRLEKILLGALEEARWCAADPICIESSGQGPGSMNLAACHACSLLPETSCELRNQVLDRETVQKFFQ